MSGLLDDLGVAEPPVVPPRTPDAIRRPLPMNSSEAWTVPTAPAPLSPLKRFHLLTVDDVRKLPRLECAISGVFPVSGVAAIFGPSGSGKSFLNLDMAATLGDGGEWFGHKVKACRVVYVCLEGDAGIRQRVEAWERANGRRFPDALRFVFGSFTLTDRNDVLALAAAIDEAGGADVILIDTLNRAAPEMDENSSRDMGMALEGCKELQGMTGGLLILTHHTGKDATKGMRGHSSLFAALDAAIEVTRTDERRSWSVAKAKDGQDGQDHPFRLEVIELGDDENGDPITSCVVRPPLHDGPVVPSVRLPKGGNQRVIYDALCPLFRESYHFGKASAPASRPCIQLDEAIAKTRDRLTVPSDRRTERTRQALTGLITSGVLSCNEGWLWLK